MTPMATRTHTGGSMSFAVLDAAELIFARLDGYRGPSQHRTISTRLVIRGSGEIQPVASMPSDTDERRTR